MKSLTLTDERSSLVLICAVHHTAQMSYLTFISLKSSCKISTKFGYVFSVVTKDAEEVTEVKVN